MLGEGMADRGILCWLFSSGVWPLTCICGRERILHNLVSPPPSLSLQLTPSLFFSCADSSRSLPEYVFSTLNTPTPGVSIHLFQGATLLLPKQSINITVETKWPYSTQVAIVVSAATPTSLKLRVRIPTWTTASTVSVAIALAGNSTAIGWRTKARFRAAS